MDLWEFAFVAIAAFGASLLTFFSGFGLGTILTPVFVLFFPPEIAILLTAIVHFLNNIFKTGLIGRYIDKTSLIRFGLPSVIGAFGGAYFLNYLSQLEDTANAISLNFVLGILIIFFGIFDIIPQLKNLRFDTKWLFPGGLLSGFFGGLSGHQGALRSAFLIKTNLTKEQFVATGTAIALFVDSTRISSYVFSGKLNSNLVETNFEVLSLAVGSAFLGAMLGKKFLTKIKIGIIQFGVAGFMVLVGLLMIFGNL